MFVRIPKMPATFVSRPDNSSLCEMLRVERLEPAGDLPQRARPVHPL